MSTTVLELIQSAASEMGLAPPAAVYANTDLTAVQLGALFNATGEMLVKRKAWRMLFREYTITTVDGVGDYALPADFARPISQTEWDRTNRWPMIGPETSQQWQWLKSGILSTGPRERFRLVGNVFQVWPVPEDTLTFNYYYVGKWWVQDSLGAYKAKANADTDTCIFDDRLMISGVKQRFFQAKQFNSEAFAAEFMTNLEDAMAQDEGAPILSMAKQACYPLISVANLQDGNWPG